ncbi:hypothetical protein [Corynebacterium cystitidis]|uniref:hypothetical protein n=1 Tax=Corynebacterium cystitidis TaxID=35757 RepID=UPI00211DF7A4|nr:hypothetical protein [Corynebacterium cystitidis]
MPTIAALIALNDNLAPAVNWSTSDATLSGGEHALTAIIDVLVEHFDSLDARQQRALVDVLDTQTKASEASAAYLRDLFARRTAN